MVWRVLAVSAVVAGVAAPAAALPGPPLRGEAARLMDRGDWAGASAAGRRQGDATGLAIAAHCALVRAAFVVRDRAEAERLLDEADRDLELARTKEPGNYLVNLAAASALGYRATFTRSRRLTAQARDLMLDLTRADPARPEAYIAYGTWNGEVLLNVGPMVGRLALGASRAKMEEALASGFARDPASPLAPSYRGLLLLRLGEESAARLHLGQALALKPRNAYEAMVRRDAADVTKLLAAGRPTAARDLANVLAAFGWLKAAKTS